MPSFGSKQPDLTADIPGFRVSGKLHESAPRVVVRATRTATGEEVVLKTLAARYPRKRDLAELSREYEIAKKLDLDAVIRVQELVTYGEGNLAIVMEPFGLSLADIQSARGGQPFSLASFFVVALQVARVLGHLHERDIVHKDVVPRNILFDEASGQIRLIDFGISSELGRERQSVTLSRRLEGSLPYISPEQTGRMNRDLDYRSDYYSLGVTFFEILTGRLPFEASSPLEWVHHHISRSAPRVHEVNPEVPFHVSAIVEKLMAKNAEERYQSTYGLIADLEEARGQGSPSAAYVLGRSDVSRRFQLPQQLYGRESELAELRERFDGVSGGETSLCLIKGYSGVGKSALANELSKSIVGERGYLIGGKFDQFRQNSAYSAVSSAFRDLLRQVLGESGARLEQLRLALIEALAPNAQLIVDLVPELESIIGPQPLVPALPPTEAQNRFQLVFQSFVRQFASREHPLVLFLDDLQWSDVPTLHLLQRLTTSREISHLLVIGAYRSNAVDPTHPLLITLDEIKKSRSVLEQSIGPLSREAVQRFVADTVHQDASVCAAFSDAVFDKAQGNPLFLGELLKAMHEEGSLVFDPEGGRWRYSVADVQRAQVGENVVEFMVAHLRRLPEVSQRVLSLAACIGNTFDLKTLSIIAEIQQTEAARALEEPLRRNMVIPLSDEYRYASQGLEEVSPNPGEQSGPQLLYKFQHDRVQQAAYELILESAKQSTHLSIGRLIQQSTTEAELEERLIEVVSHLNAGRALVPTQQERLELARLNLRAGVNAMGASAYNSALQFLKVGRELLPDDSWDSQYELSAALCREHQQCAYLTADYDAADTWADLLLERQRTALEKAETLSARTRQYSTSGRLQESITAAISGLALLGVTFEESPDPSAIAHEVQAVERHLAGRRIEDLIHAPHLTSPEDAVAIRLLMEIFPAAFLSGSGNLFPYLVLKSVNISLEKGNSAESAFAYAAYGMLLCGALNDPALGYEYGKLAVAMNDHFDDIALKSRVIYVYTMFIHHFSNHWSTMTPWFLRGIESGYQSGDLLYLAYSAQDCVIWDPKLDLDVASREQRKYLRIVKDCEYRDSYDSGSLFLQMQLNFQGLTKSRASLDDESFNEAECLAGMRQRRFMTGVANYHIYKAEICYFYDDFPGAIGHIREQDRLMASAMSLPQLVRFYIVSFCTRARLIPTLDGEARRETKERLDEDFRQMSLWAAHCPVNFEHLRLMMAGELARLAGDLTKALSCFEGAILAARSHEYRRDEGQANELAARALLDVGLPKAAEGYLRAAHYIYYRWGARGKVLAMVEAHPAIFGAADVADRAATTRNTTTHSTESTDLDLASVIKASQAISGQIVLDQFWKTTLEILLENAGGQRGRFIVRSGQELVVRAETGTWDEATGEARLPVTIINSSLRTGLPIVLGNVAETMRFASDPYVLVHKPRSLLCIPLRSTKSFEGAIYIENNVASGAFSEDRVEVIKLLSAQAVISVENAKLYEDQLRLTEAQSRFVPSQFLERLGHHDISEVNLGQHVATEMTVLFADLRNFTPLVEQVGPDQVIALLNRYFSKMAGPITNGGGFIDSYIGDAIMALFGGGADSALRAAIGMHRGLDAFNEESRRSGQRELTMGVGLNTGPLVLGTVGSVDRLKCGVVGDTVNLGSRIEQLTKTYQAPLLIGESTYGQLEDPDEFSLRKIDRVAVKGKARAVTLYEVLDAETPSRRTAKEANRSRQHEGLASYFDEDFVAAANIFDSLCTLDPEDPVYRLLAERAHGYVIDPPRANWDGAAILTHK